MDDAYHISYIQLRVGQTFLDADRLQNNLPKHVKELGCDEERIKFGAIAHCSGYLQACKDFGILSHCMRDKMLNEYITMEK